MPKAKFKLQTCGFIGPARAESVAVLRELAEAKKPGQILIAAGCMSQRYGAAMIEEVPGLDGIIGTRRWMDIVDLVGRLRERPYPEPIFHLPDRDVTSDEWRVARLSSPVTRHPRNASAYLKIADGCRRPCAFCAIPLIKGTAVSRLPEAIVAEAVKLQSLGVRELILIAQDTTDYGHDLGTKDGLADLLDRLVAAAPGIDWIRIMYAYPGYVTDRLIDTMARHPQIAHYLDMPLQHGHPMTLRRMRRPANVDWVHRTIERMRAAMPDLAIRTTFLLGYPGETEEEFQTLLDFAAELKFDRVGCFTFSFEPGTESEALGDPIPLEVKEERRARLMEQQQRISLERNQAQVGKTLKVLVEGNNDGLSLGRSYRDAPEIDGMVIVEGDLPVGEIVPVRISGAMAYDLTGDGGGEGEDGGDVRELKETGK
ncbi:MAG: 30S ribosomal protein S12 methylthiotransferase RimO [Chloroflexi bacterium]|nr:30S ribosomal protein S12 methylthiotransferase RimO [Chloroflexota bacterium]